jgi:phospholipase/carboxylesterase
MITKLDVLTYNNQPHIAPQKVMILLHGLGDNNHNFAALIPMLTINCSMLFIIPNAPTRPITINNSMPMNAWYDLYALSDTIDRKIDYTGINGSVNLLESLITDTITKYKIKSSDIILGGFSQGGVMSYMMALKSQYKFAGVIALSCYLPTTINSTDNTNITTPIFAAHGVNDDVVAYQLGNNAFTQFANAKYQIKWQQYQSGHTITREELKDISLWVNTII